MLFGLVCIVWRRLFRIAERGEFCCWLTAAATLQFVAAVGEFLRKPLVVDEI